MKTKYRIIIGGHAGTPYPYRIQMKKDSLFSFWTEISYASSLENAEDELREHINKNLPPPGTVVKIYDETDLLVDKLKGIM
jgi:hypothetical protein